MSAQVWIEAESFSDFGGWVVDEGSMEVMGSAYLMAHGMGIPVTDASTTCVIPSRGEWHVWARTRDWTAVWNRGTSAGRFTVKIGGEELPEILGTNGCEWGWQKAGSIVLSEGEVAVALHDLTGFNGRCDALYLTLDPNETPGNRFDSVEDLRKNTNKIKTTDMPDEFDLVVVGGGIAGVCTAVSAIKNGLKVALMQDRDLLGGCNSSEIRVSAGGLIHLPPYPNLGNVVKEITPVMGSGSTFSEEVYEDARKKNVFRLLPEKQYTLSVNERVIRVENSEADPSVITAVITRSCRTGQEKRYKAKYFADCSGDALLARLMGADVMYGREASKEFHESLAPKEADNQVMGVSVLWFARTDEKPSTFPDVDWGLEFNEDNAYYIRRGDWEWETGQYRDQVKDAEYIRDYGLMALYANWSFLKNHSVRKAEWANNTLDWVSPIGGKRESYRVVGDYVLNQNDIEEHKEFPDATGTMGWNIDIHYPDPENEAKFSEAFRSCAYHRGIGLAYPVPYRCLYSKDVKNLFLGGRHISLTHVAFSCARVMRTLGILGEVIGMAASICAKEQVYPRDIYTTHFDKLKELMTKGISFPIYHPGRGVGPDETETYHFKELGHIRIHNLDDVEKIDENLKQRILSLGVEHKHKHPRFE